MLFLNFDEIIQTLFPLKTYKISKKIKCIKVIQFSPTSKKSPGTSLAVQWLRLRGHRFSLWSGNQDLYAVQKTGGKEREEEKTEKRTSSDFFRPSRPSFWAEPTLCLPPIRPSNRTLTPPTKLLSRPLFEQFLNSIHMLFQLNQFTEVMFNISH